MGILKGSEKPDALQGFEELLAKLSITEDLTVLIENRLKCLSLDGTDKARLIERGPDRPRDARAPQVTPYQTRVQGNIHVSHYVSHNHTCGGLFIYPQNVQQHPRDHHLEDNYPAQNVTVTDRQSACKQCTDIPACDNCILQLANTPAFKNFVADNLIPDSGAAKKSPPSVDAGEATNLNIPNIANVLTVEQACDNSTSDSDTSDSIFVKPAARRFSLDSGFQSDNPSPLSDSVLSPKPTFTMPPNNPETKAKIYRKILPKPTEGHSEQATFFRSNNSAATQNGTKASRKVSAQQLLRTTLNPDVKQEKWVEVMLKREDELFATDSTGETILHKLLRSDEEYIAESFYALLEKMRRNPAKCKYIVATQSSICRAISDNNHPELFKDYFQEVIQLIQDQTRNRQ